MLKRIICKSFAAAREILLHTQNYTLIIHYKNIHTGSFLITNQDRNEEVSGPVALPPNHRISILFELKSTLPIKGGQKQKVKEGGNCTYLCKI